MALGGGRAQRRADAFAAALDANGSAGSAGSSDATTRRLTAVAGAIATLPLATIATPETARIAGRAALVAAAGEAARHAGAAALTHAAGSAAASSTASSAASTAAATGTAGATAATGTTAATAVTAAAGIAHLAVPVVSGLVAAAVAVSGVAVAAHRSLPGQPFYVLKTASESVRLDLAGSPSAKAHDRLSFAAARLSEIRALSGQPQTPLVVARTKVLLAQFDADIKAASGPLLAAGGASAQALWNAVTAASTELQTLTATLPAALKADATQALSLLTVSQLLVKTVLPGLPDVAIPPGVPNPVTGLLNTLLHPSTAPTSVATSAPTTGTAPTEPTGASAPGTPRPSASPPPTATSRPTTGPTSSPTSGPTLLPTLPTLPSILPTLPTSLPTILPTLPTVLPTALVSAIESLLALPLPSQ